MASALAAEVYGLEILKRNIEDEPHSTTRFYVMAREPALAATRARRIASPPSSFACATSPPALYKALGGFATNGVNLTKLESYMVGGHFAATQFLCDVDGHAEDPRAAPRFRGTRLLLARDEGAWHHRAHPFRIEQAAGAD